jgi:hypothetical protein
MVTGRWKQRKITDKRIKKVNIMNTLIAKYVAAYQAEEGSSTEKIKKILMHHAHNWEWSNHSLVADLIDDANITADDIVDYLADTYEHEGGNEEFHAAVCAMKVSLRKAHLLETANHHNEFINEGEPDGDDDFHNDHPSYNMPRHMDTLHNLKY